jgi:hypothetical protein
MALVGVELIQEEATLYFVEDDQRSGCIAVSINITGILFTYGGRDLSQPQ